MQFSDLPPEMQNADTKEWFQRLEKKRGQLFAKRVFDVAAAAVIAGVTSPIMLLLAAAIKLDSPGPVFYRQVRVGRWGRPFRIFKFRTRVQDADKKGLALTVGEDARITRMGHLLRKCRLDEFAQVFNVLNGTMSLVGPRPEVPKYVEQYDPSYLPTLLVRPGVTAPSSLHFRNEDEILAASPDDPEKTYVEKVLPIKMKLNLDYLEDISVVTDLKVLWQTLRMFLSNGKDGA